MIDFSEQGLIPDRTGLAYFYGETWKLKPQNSF